ncbi:hypothetical protein FOPG_20112 [Fusarium oxysporum f. sp. conglutinans race 2 54008]|uniref:Uncharacterized protein n=1 Tax=Fusarium oxysporum f. sp. conglutinans race 2 54008 TaxID=1089457 RepID=X0HQV5_FUSOX|nr:hypothetical protein FOPG_20112 [Fusarium oxysporum f. sp. conglutinans race 2 54008]
MNTPIHINEPNTRNCDGVIAVKLTPPSVMIVSIMQHMYRLAVRLADKCEIEELNGGSYGLPTAIGA